MSKKAAAEKIIPAEPFPSQPIPFTGLARSVECFNNNGQFRNFRIVTMYITDGIVTKVEKSDPYASWECIAFMEKYNMNSILNLNNNWQEGKTLCI